MENKFRMTLLDGTATDVPDISSKIVRVFISSTFSDMIWERNALMEKVYPKLKDYCRDHYGLEFQAVDMRWGVHADAQNDHQASSLCLQEIRNCQQLSVGPNFVILMGQKYGSRPFPNHINKSEFELLLSALEENDPAHELLTTWFRLDENSIPCRYVLQPISSILKHFNDQDPALKAADEKSWGEIYNTLKTALRKAAAVCYETGKIDTTIRDKYYISVTENEIQHGVLQYDGNKAEKCLCFIRDIEDISDNLERTKSAKFIDMSDDQVDQEAVEMLNVLKHEKIHAVLPEENQSHYTVTWSGEDGISPQAHAEYLQQFCDDFFSKMTHLIDKSMKTVTGLQNDKLLPEVVQHLKMAKAWTSVFHGREEILSKIKDYVCGPSRQPYIVYGPSGSGKTAVIAKSVSLTHSWLARVSAVTVIRFLGITPNSSGIRTVLDSICRQLSSLYGKDVSKIPSDYSQLVPYFRELLQVATSKRPIVIYLDSVDQLSRSNFAFKLTWLPKILPANVKIVLSTLPDLYDILQNLQTLLKQKENFIELEPLGDELSQESLFSRLQLVHRTLSKQQEQIVLELFKVCSLPLYTKVMFEEICNWKSYTHISAESVSSSIEGAIHKMLERLEVEHGRTLVSHTLAYLTASRTGLTLVELEDLLSLDDEVLNSVFTFWLPPIRRIPPAILTRFRLQLQGYVVDREADGVVVIFWYHRKFIEVARDRYLSDKGFALKIHSVLADYFLGTWGGGKQKPFYYTEFLASRLNLKKDTGEADRIVPLQPLEFHHDDQVTYNLRKLMELPRHLAECERFEDLRTQVVYNYKWYIAKIKAFSLQDLLADLTLAQEAIPEDKSLKQVIDVLRLGSSALYANPDCLSLELCGRLQDFSETDSNISRLLQGCEASSECMLTAPFQCFDGPTKSLVFSLEGHNKSIVDAVFLGRKEMASFGWDGMLCFWDLTSGELLKQVDASFVDPNLRAFLLLSKDGKYLVALNKVGSKFIGIYMADTGDLLHQYQHSHSQHLHKLVIGKKYICVDFGILELETGQVVNKLDKYNVNITEYVLIDFSSDEKHILIGSQKEMAMYEIGTCKKVFSIPGENIVSHLRVTPDGRCALIGYVISCIVKMVDIDQTSPTFGQELHLLDIPNLFPEMEILNDTKDLFVQEVSDINVSPDSRFAVILLKRFYMAVWDLNKPEAKPIMFENSDLSQSDSKTKRYNFSPTFTSDSKYVICYKLNGPLLVWNAQDGRFIASVQAHANEIMQLKMDYCSNLMVTVAKADLTIKVWNVEELVATPKQSHNRVKDSYIQHLVIPSCSNSAVSLHTVARYNREVYQMIDFFGLTVWDLNTGTRRNILPFGQYGQVVQMLCSDSGEIFAMVMGNLTQRRIRILNVKQNKLLFSCTQPYCIKARMSRNGKYVASVTNEEGAYLTTIRECETGLIHGLYENCYDVVFLSDCTMAALLSTTGALLSHDLEATNQSSMSVGFNSGNLHSLAGDLSAAVLAVSKPMKNGRCKGEVVSVKTQEKLGTLHGISEQGILSVSSDGKKCIDSDLKVFDLVSCKKLACLKSGCQKATIKARLISKGEYAVWVDDTVTDLLTVCRISDNTIVARCNLHATPVCLEVSPLANEIVIGTNLGQVLVFRLKNSPKETTSDKKMNSSVPPTLSLSGVSPELQAELQDLAKQARIFSFNTTTLQRKTTTLNEEPSSSYCILI